MPPLGIERVLVFYFCLGVNCASRTDCFPKMWLVVFSAVFPANRSMLRIIKISVSVLTRLKMNSTLKNIQEPPRSFVKPRINISASHRKIMMLGSKRNVLSAPRVSSFARPPGFSLPCFISFRIRKILKSILISIARYSYLARVY